LFKAKNQQKNTAPSAIVQARTLTCSIPLHKAAGSQMQQCWIGQQQWMQTHHADCDSQLIEAKFFVDIKIHLNT